VNGLRRARSWIVQQTCRKYQRLVSSPQSSHSRNEARSLLERFRAARPMYDYLSPNIGIVNGVNFGSACTTSRRRQPSSGPHNVREHARR